jgi:hypothetical protein
VVATVLIVLGSLFYVQSEPHADGNDNKSLARSHNTGSQRALHSTPSDRGRDSYSSHISRVTSPIQDDETIENNNVRHDIDRTTQSPEEQIDLAERGVLTEGETFDPVPLSISNKHRNRVATMLNRFVGYLGTPAPDRYDNSVFAESKREFPAIPGEAGRVAGFEDLRVRYKSSVPQDDEASILGPVISRTNSFSSRLTTEGGPTNRDRSPSQSLRSPTRSYTNPPEQSRFLSSEAAADTMATPTVKRRDTLQVPHRPQPIHVRPRNASSPSTPPRTVIPDMAGSPTIVVSAEPEETSPVVPRIDNSPYGPH